MWMYDSVPAKERGRVLPNEETACMVWGFVSGGVPDYQMSAMLMTIYFQGVNEEEMTYLALEMAHSGDMADLSAIENIKMDKHSTGGVGDKTTLVIESLVASLGVRVIRMPDRGLGHTGGTIDKMGPIPGLRISIPKEGLFKVVNRMGTTIIGQSESMVSADKKLYTLRNVTVTVDSIPLIASSIMSKKLAANSDDIVLDVKARSSAFMKTLEDSIALIRETVAIGTGTGRSYCGLITDMDVPLGHVIGSAMEVVEAVGILQGEGPEDLTEVCLQLAAHILYMADRGETEACCEMAKRALGDGSGLQTLAAMVKVQGGNEAHILDTGRFGKARSYHEAKVEWSGYVAHIDTEVCGIASVMLRAGRNHKKDMIDYPTGIYLEKKYGNVMEADQVLAMLYASDESLFAKAEKKLLDAYEIGGEPAAPKKLICARVTKGAVVRF